MSAARGIVWRAAAGTAGAALVTATVFPRDLLRMDSPATTSLSLGLLAALVLALVRSGRPRGAAFVLALASAFQFGAALPGGAARGVCALGGALGIGAGLFAAAVVFDELAPAIRVGKFLVIGPALGLAFLAATPLMALAREPRSLGILLWTHLAVGLVAGDGAGLGVELAELSRRRRPAG